jgi:hypothetical protein
MSLAYLPATSRQKRVAVAVACILLLGLAASAPFADVALPRADAFIPAIDTAIFVTDFLTSMMLFAHLSIYRSRAVLALASGYFFTSLFVIPHALSWPGAFSAAGLLGGGPQTSAWIYVFWHIGYPAALLIYGFLRSAKYAKQMNHKSIPLAIGLSVMILSSLAFGCLWLAQRGDEFLSPLMLDEIHYAISYKVAFILILSLFAIAFVLLWIRRPTRRSR